MIDKGKIQEAINRLLLSRIRILDDHGFYGLLLMHIIFTIDENCPTAATDGKRIFFSPDFLDSLSDSELDFIMMHEILHVVLLHVLRGEELENERHNIACDIVINSNIMLERGLTRPIVINSFGIAMHLAPNGQEGHLFTSEEVYEMLPPDKKKKKGVISRPIFDKGRAVKEQIKPQKETSSFDDHSRWGTLMEEDAILRDVWVKNIMDAAEAISIQNSVKGRGKLPAFAERIINKLKKPQIDWRTILNDFIQEEINDYSFSPPDRRFNDSPFFLPDFNEKDEMVKKIRAAGGGGTDFQIIFEYVARYMEETPPASIIILTDGCAPFPEERLANDIPVLWLLNNEDTEPPWGKIARIKV